jgi:hypothetical protein
MVYLLINIASNFGAISQVFCRQAFDADPTDQRFLWTQGIDARSQTLDVLLCAAAAGGCVGLMTSLYSSFGDAHRSRTLPIFFSYLAMVAAAGQRRALLWLRDYLISGPVPGELTNFCFSVTAASIGGQIDVLRWALHSQENAVAEAQRSGVPSQVEDSNLAFAICGAYSCALLWCQPDMAQYLHAQYGFAHKKSFFLGRGRLWIDVLTSPLHEQVLQHGPYFRSVAPNLNNLLLCRRRACSG